MLQAELIQPSGTDSPTGLNHLPCFVMGDLVDASTAIVCIIYLALPYSDLIVAYRAIV